MSCCCDMLFNRFCSSESPRLLKSKPRLEEHWKGKNFFFLFFRWGKRDEINCWKNWRSGKAANSQHLQIATEEGL